MTGPSAGHRSPAPSAREVPSAAIASAAITSEPSSSPGARAPQVPTRIALRAPREISSWSTIAAEGPPIPVAWIVTVPPSGAVPVYPHRPRLWLNMRGSSSSVWASISARPGSPGSSTRVAQGCGRAEMEGLAGRQGRDSRLEGRWGMADALIATRRTVER